MYFPSQVTLQISVANPGFLVLRLKDPGVQVTMDTLFTALNTQLAGVIGIGQAVAFRFQSIRLWGPIPTTNNELILQVSDLFANYTASSAAIAGTLGEFSNFADQVNRARIGYAFSSAQQQVSVVATTQLQTLLCRTSGAGPGSVMYVNLLWRPHRSGPPTLTTRVEVPSEESEGLTLEELRGDNCLVLPSHLEM
jgi:hypothetical protein